MKVSKIERQKKQSQRYSIFLNNQFAFGVDEQVLIHFNLRKGMDLDQEMVNAILKEDYQQKLYLRGLNYLSYGLRSEEEMRTYLLKLPGLTRDHLIDLRDFQAEGSQANKKDQAGGHLPVDLEGESSTPVLLPQDLVDLIIARLKDQDLINDTHYAASYVRTQAELNRKGPRVIYHELLRRGIQDSLARSSLDEVYHEEMIEANIVKLAENYLKTKKDLPYKMRTIKVQQYLLQKGYPKETIATSLQKVEDTQNDQEEAQLISRYAHLSLNKRRDKLQGYALKQRVFNDLLRKGFTYDIIQGWIQSHEDDFENEEE